MVVALARLFPSVDARDQRRDLPSAVTRPAHRGRSRAARLARRPAARRSAWVLVDQGVSSLTNFVASIAVARAVSSELFGAFSVAVLASIVVVNLARALVSQPLAIRVSAQVEQRAEVAAAAGAALLCGTAAGVVVLPIGLGIPGSAGDAVIVVGILLPALVLQDTWRYCLFTMGRPGIAVVNDLVWAGCQAVFLFAAFALDSGSVLVLTMAWAGGALVAAAAGIQQSGVAPALGEGLRFIRRHLSLGWRFAAETVIASGSAHVTMLAVGVTLGAAGVGAIRGGATLFGPFTAAFLGLMAAGIAEGSRLLARAPQRLVPVLAFVSVLLFAMSVTWGAVLLLMPESWGRALLGDTWAGAHGVIVPFAAGTAGAGVASGGFLGLRVMAAASSTLRIRIVTGAATVAAGLVGAISWGPTGAVAGIAIGRWANAVGAWWLLVRHRARHPAVPARGAVAPGGAGRPKHVRTARRSGAASTASRSVDPEG